MRGEHAAELAAARGTVVLGRVVALVSSLRPSAFRGTGMFAFDRLRDLFAAHGTRGPDAIVASILRSVIDFADEQTTT